MPKIIVEIEGPEGEPAPIANEIQNVLMNAWMMSFEVREIIPSEPCLYCPQEEPEYDYCGRCGRGL